MRIAFISAAIAALVLSAGIASGAPRDYRVGDVVIYDNPNDDVPPRKGRVTRVDDGKLWIDFGEFQSGLKITEQSQILWLHTNAVDDWTRPAGAAPAPDAAAAPAPRTMGAAPPTAPADAGDASDVFGKWSTFYVGHPVAYAPGDGYIYLRQERGAQGGLLIIRRDGTYTWNTNSGIINGRWRAAKADEIRGGFGRGGIRLLRGENGWDYTVQRRPRTSNTVPDSIALWTSGYQVNAYRVQ
jgi:hypothetical protein